VHRAFHVLGPDHPVMVRAHHRERAANQAEAAMLQFAEEVPVRGTPLEVVHHVADRRYFRPLVDVMTADDGTNLAILPMGGHVAGRDEYVTTRPVDLAAAGEWITSTGYQMAEGETLVVTVPLAAEQVSHVTTPLADPEVEAELFATFDALTEAVSDAYRTEYVAKARAEMVAATVVHLAEIAGADLAERLDPDDLTDITTDENDPPPRRVSPVATCAPSTAPPRGLVRRAVTVSPRSLAPPG
jgi:hypothetical protein